MSRKLDCECCPFIYPASYGNDINRHRYPDGRDTLDFCQALIKRVKLPEKITLHCNYHDHDTDDDSSDLVAEMNDTPTEVSIFTRLCRLHSRLPLPKPFVQDTTAQNSVPWLAHALLRWN